MAQALSNALESTAQTVQNGTEQYATVGVKLSKKGVDKKGRGVYESDFDSSVPMEERIKIFKERISTIFNLGAVHLNTDTKKITVNGDKFTLTKTLYGDKDIKDYEYDTRINALYDLADILSGSKFKKKTIEESYYDPTIPPKNAAHKKVKYWYKFTNHIVFDGEPYIVTFNIRDKGKEQYAYLIEFKNEQKNRGAQHSHTIQKESPANLLNSSSEHTVPQPDTVVISQYMQTGE